MGSMSRPEGSPRPLPVLLLAADTGGGHRAAAEAISAELLRLYPGRFAPVLCDPLGGVRSIDVLPTGIPSSR